MTNLNEMKSTELKAMAKELGVKNWWLLKKTDLIIAIEDSKLGPVPEIIEPEMVTPEPAKEIVINMVDNTWKDKATQVSVHLAELKPKGFIEHPELKEEIKAAEPIEPIADEDIVTLKEIIHKMGIKGTKARRLLRNADIERPYKRWEWHKEQHKHIIEKVKGLLK
jgi:endonuclease III-like uncharacterized protein